MNTENINALMNATDSAFSITPGNLQITFNYLYFLGYSLRMSEEVTKLSIDVLKEKIKENSKSYIYRDWKNSEAAHFTRNNFITDVILDHFHLQPNKIFNDKYIIVEDSLVSQYTPKREFKFAIDYQYTNDSSLNSIASIECSILKNGHLILSIRLTYVGTSDTGQDQNIPAYSVVDLIKKPELVRSIDYEKQVGELIRAVEKQIYKIEEEINNILAVCQYERKVLEVDENNLYKSEYVKALSIKNNSEKEGTSRSRPYIGTLFRFQGYGHNQVEHLIPSIRKFVIASARTTPPFSTMFVDEENYLESRDIYKPGRSIVYIARRGWCVFDTEEQDRQAFMLGTVESTHMVITTLLATARSWRIYISDCEKKGKEIFYKLNAAINKYISNPNNETRKVFTNELGIATSFLASARLVSPQKGINKLIEAHHISHTARMAVHRCQDLTQISELEQVSEYRINEYINFMGIAEDYLQISSLDLQVSTLEKTNKTLCTNTKMLKIAIGTLIAAIFSIIVAILAILVK